MKFILFAAAALIAVPAMAQTSGSTGTSSPSNVGASDQPNSMKNPAAQDAPPADPSTATSQQMPMQSAPTDSQMPMGQGGSMSNSGGNMTAGGYQPSQPMPMATGGQQPVFTPGPSVAQAFPAPAPLASYPVCKKGQYDKCMQRGGK